MSGGPPTLGDLGSAPIDALGEDVAMARVRGALFGTRQPARLDRYAVLKKLGEGGYGVVYAAWDERLDRKIALKVLHAGAPPRLQDEARALAKLAHPNIVTVHDVAEAGGQRFVAMEFVEGQTLARWAAQPHPWREVLAIYRQAARGLAAAHEVGLVHRDFKPANAILGVEGRVRVLDFGLARMNDAPNLDVQSTLDEDGSARSAPPGTCNTHRVGTPRYMPPEQHCGEPADARSDQYSFCAAVWEALMQQPPFPGDTMEALLEHKLRTPPTAAADTDVPAPIVRALQRGLRPAPADRFEDMGQLIAALGHDPRIARRRVAVGGALLAAMAAGAWWSPEADPCSGAGSTIRETWSPARVETLQRDFAATGSPHAAPTWDSTHAKLQAWASRWQRANVDACEDHRRGSQSAETLDRRTACLDDRRRHFDALLDVFDRADSDILDKAVNAAANLPGLEACADVQSLLDAHPVPAAHAARIARWQDELAHARAEVEAGRYSEAHDRSTAVLEAYVSEEIEYPPIAVAARGVRGDAAGYRGDTVAAQVDLRAAALEAQRIGAHEAFARTAASMVWEVGEVGGDFERALLWADLGQASVLNSGSDPLLATILLNNRASVLTTAGRYDEAAADQRQRLELVERHWGAEDPLAMMSYANLANIDNHRGLNSQAEANYRRAIELGSRALGRTHPRVLTARQNLVGMLVRAGRTELGLRETHAILALQTEVLGPKHPDLSAVHVNLSMTYYQARDFDAALEHAVAARTVTELSYGPLSHRLVEPLLAESDARAARGDLDASLAIAQRAQRIATATLGPRHNTTAFTLRAVGEQLRRRQDIDAARIHLEQAHSIFAELGVESERKLTEQRLDELSAP